MLTLKVALQSIFSTVSSVERGLLERFCVFVLLSFICSFEQHIECILQQNLTPLGVAADYPSEDQRRALQPLTILLYSSTLTTKNTTPQMALLRLSLSLNREF